MDYLSLLAESYATSQSSECPPGSRVEFLAVHIFGFTTYDAELDALFGKRALEVFQAISEGRTLGYIQDKEQYRWYVIMCNMPFFAGRLDWGTSIRGAWWGIMQPTIESDGLFMNGKQIPALAFGCGQWADFVAAVVAFSKGVC